MKLMRIIPILTLLALLMPACAQSDSITPSPSESGKDVKPAAQAPIDPPTDSKPRAAADPPPAAQPAAQPSAPKSPQAAPPNSGASTQPNDYAQQRAKHGPNAVVHARGKARKTKQKLTLHDPDWSKPFPLTFRQLKKNYNYFRVHKEFFEQGLPRIHGSAISMAGAVMPIDPVGEDGEIRRFWLANPVVVMAGCVFCNPPTLADLVYVTVPGEPLKVDREELYRSIVTVEILGRFKLGAQRTPDGFEYMFELELKRVVD